jgi:hypothetical protein
MESYERDRCRRRTVPRLEQNWNQGACTVFVARCSRYVVCLGHIPDIPAVWEYENRHGHLPSSADATKELVEIADQYRQELEVNTKCLPQIDESLME